MATNVRDIHKIIHCMHCMCYSIQLYMCDCFIGCSRVSLSPARAMSLSQILTALAI